MQKKISFWKWKLTHGDHTLCRKLAINNFFIFRLIDLKICRSLESTIPCIVLKFLRNWTIRTGDIHYTVHVTWPVMWHVRMISKSGLYLQFLSSDSHENLNITSHNNSLHSVKISKKLDHENRRYWPYQSCHVTSLLTWPVFNNEKSGTTLKQL